MTDVLGWRRIAGRATWADDLDTAQSVGEEHLTDLRTLRTDWSEAFGENRPTELIEGLPLGLVDAYVTRAMLHAYTREIELGTWFSTVAGLDGAWGDGGTRDEARDELRAALIGWIAVRRRLGYEIPAIEGLDLNLPRAVEA